MERGCNGGGGVKVTFIETQFVTSDAAGFKSLVQRLTGNEAVVAPPPPPVQRPRPCRAAADVRRRDGCHGGVGRRRAAAAVPAAPANWVEEMMLLETCDLGEMVCGVDGGVSGGYGGFSC